MKHKFFSRKPIVWLIDALLLYTLVGSIVLIYQHPDVLQLQPHPSAPDLQINKLGWNIFTITMIGTGFFLIIGSYGLYVQAAKIWQTRSGESVSVTNFCFGIAINTMSVIYGGENAMIALLINSAARGLMHIPIVIGLFKFKELTRWEKKLLVIFALATAIGSLPGYTESVFLIFCIVGIFTYADQPLEVLAKNRLGSVTVRLHSIYLYSGIFWLMYAFIIGNRILMLLQPVFVALVFTTVCIGVWYERKNPIQSTSHHSSPDTT